MKDKFTEFGRVFGFHKLTEDEQDMLGDDLTKAEAVLEDDATRNNVLTMALVTVIQRATGEPLTQEATDMLKLLKYELNRIRL